MLIDGGGVYMAVLRRQPTAAQMPAKIFSTSVIIHPLCAQRHVQWRWRRWVKVMPEWRINIVVHTVRYNRIAGRNNE